jgi:hypothetical protein
MILIVSIPFVWLTASNEKLIEWANYSKRQVGVRR